ncbi:unnamed protein product [Vitrella brassicaformis CCMP3155]|uniref:Uncharacterized protein n=1 Tax=Vitrella brassicaformis (strain CCMP3155) TaxID=1169540 RepID=A0A0G4EFW3_VITBC|nr:unnamed protein product [Vitrella brassicaformis CCMP3155]|eukprot:CEL94372.1 unnamed protein product [Vitrella brassicaformis CCMP3155]
MAVPFINRPRVVMMQQQEINAVRQKIDSLTILTDENKGIVTPKKLVRWPCRRAEGALRRREAQTSVCRRGPLCMSVGEGVQGRLSQVGSIKKMAPKTPMLARLLCCFDRFYEGEQVKSHFMRTDGRGSSPWTTRWRPPTPACCRCRPAGSRPPPLPDSPHCATGSGSGTTSSSRREPAPPPYTVQPPPHLDAVQGKPMPPSPTATYPPPAQPVGVEWERVAWEAVEFTFTAPHGEVAVQGGWVVREGSGWGSWRELLFLPAAVAQRHRVSQWVRLAEVSGWRRYFACCSQPRL